MKRAFISIFFILLLVVLNSCSDKKQATVPVSLDTESMVKLRMQVHCPDVHSPSRAVAESQLREASVMVFDYEGGQYIYKYIVQGYSLSTSPVADYQFLARLIPSSGPLKLYIMANAGTAVNAATIGMNEQQVKEAVTMAYTSSGFTDVLPMTGILELEDGLVADREEEAALLRSAARVDVVNSAANFNLTSVKVYRAADMVQLIPDSEVNNVVTSPSIPSGTAYSVSTATFTATAQALLEQIYIPESAMPDQQNRTLQATTVVVGGEFQNSGVTTYYRMDFIPDEAPQLFGQVLRNHRYRFNIQEVLAQGWSTDDQAAVNPSTAIQAEVVEWNEVTTNMVFDNVYYFGVSTRNVQLPYNAGASSIITVQTNVSTYTAYWCDEDGNIDDEAGSIIPGESFNDPQDIFEVTISPSGTSVTVVALKPYDPASILPKYLKFTAGRLEMIISINQGPPTYRPGGVSVFGTTQELGSFGNIVLGNYVQPGNRAKGLVPILISENNFGPEGTVAIDGIYISGLNVTTQLQASLLDMFDVVYLPYPYDPEPAPIINWLDAREERVLIVHYDTSPTNVKMMTSLLGSYTYSRAGTVTPYTLSPNAPAFITNGPFGIVSPDLQYRCQDDGHGQLSQTIAAANNITPILLNSSGGVVLGVNTVRGIVYCGDIDLYSNEFVAGRQGVYINSDDGVVNNEAKVLMANLWAWICEKVLTE